MPCGATVGTAVEVRNLFFNTPVRRKFLRATQTEMAHVSEAFTRLALAYPGVHFTLAHGGKSLYDLPPTEDLEKENFDHSFSVVFVGDADAARIEQTLMSISEVEKVTVSPLGANEAPPAEPAPASAAGADKPAAAAEAAPAGAGASRRSAARPRGHHRSAPAAGSPPRARRVRASPARVSRLRSSGWRPWQASPWRPRLAPRSLGDASTRRRAQARQRRPRDGRRARCRVVPRRRRDHRSPSRQRALDPDLRVDDAQCSRIDGAASVCTRTAVRAEEGHRRARAAPACRSLRSRGRTVFIPRAGSALAIA